MERMSKRASISRLANAIARSTCEAFDKSQFKFREITRRASQRFSARDWHGMHDDSAARLDVYETAVDEIVGRIHELLDPHLGVKQTERDEKRTPPREVPLSGP